MEHEGIKAYSGDGKYIFISYSHQDRDQVFPIIEHLQKNGYNIWFDEGINAGTEWPEVIAQQIIGCACFLGFISNQSVESTECRNEIYLASNEKKDIISVLLEETDLPAGLRMKLAAIQAIEKYNYSNEGQFYIKLLEAEELHNCKNTEEFQIIGENKLVRYNGKLNHITIPDCITQVGYNAFENCDQLKSIHITENIDRIGKFAFYRTNSLIRFKVDEGNGFFSAKDDVLLNKTQNILLRYPSQKPDKTYHVPDSIGHIMMLAFSDAANLQSVSMGDQVKLIGERAFESCREMLYIQLSSNIEVLNSYTFSRCSSMITFDMPDSIRILKESVFSGCSSLQRIHLSEQLEEIGDMCFAYCESLKSVSFPEKLKVIPSYGFYECSQLEEVDLSYVEEIESYAFKNCENLRRIVFPKQLRKIGYAAFSGCSSLEEIVIPGNVACVEGYSFDRCSNLKRVILEDGVKEIQKGAFEADINLETVQIPSSVEKIADNAFHKCEKLKQ